MNEVVYIEALTGYPERVRTQLVRYYSKLPEPMRLSVHRRQTELIRANRDRSNLQMLSGYNYAMFLLAIADWREAERTLKTGSGVNAERAALVHALRVQRIKAKKIPGPVRKSLKDLIQDDYYITISNLRVKDGLSWRDVAEYLRVYEGLQVDYSHLCHCFMEVSRTRK